MFNCKDLNSLSVLSLYEGEFLGSVDKLYFDKKLTKLCEIELIGFDGVKMILPTQNIYHIGKNAITVKNNQAVILRERDENLTVVPIGSKAYTISGEFLGIVKEIELTPKYKVESVLTENNQTLDVKRLATCGKNTLIFHSEETKIGLKKFSPKKPIIYKKKDVVLTSIQPYEEANIQETQTKQSTLDADFLIGRKCSKDIFGFNNELLIKANSIINKKNLNEIKKFGKLRELMLYLK